MQKRNIRLCYAIAFLQGLVFYAPVATLYRQANGVGVFQITVIESISLAASLAMELPWGWIADRIGYRNTLVICHFLYFISKIVFWRAEGFGWFLTERLLLSIVLSGLSGCDSAYLFLSMSGNNCPERESRRIFGLWEALNTAGLVLACMVFSLFIGENYRLAALFSAYTYGAALFALPVFAIRPFGSCRRPAQTARILGHALPRPAVPALSPRRRALGGKQTDHHGVLKSTPISAQRHPARCNGHLHHPGDLVEPFGRAIAPLGWPPRGAPFGYPAVWHGRDGLYPHGALCATHPFSCRDDGVERGGRPIYPFAYGHSKPAYLRRQPRDSVVRAFLCDEPDGHQHKFGLWRPGRSFGDSCPFPGGRVLFFRSISMFPGKSACQTSGNMISSVL